MVLFPDNYDESWTLVESIERRGIGLHSGEFSEVSLRPYDKPGFYVSWIGSSQSPILLTPKQVIDTPLCTTHDLGNGKLLATVEHLLAALSGCGLTHAHIQVSGNEIPLLDGSALDWVEAIKEAGLKKVSSNRNHSPLIDNPVVKSRGDSFIVATPSRKFKLIGVIDFPYKAIGKQVFSIELTPKMFVQEIAPARTFGFKDQLEKLKEAGLIKGGDLDNALVCDGNNWVNPPLRFQDEPVRHKILDLIGDLSLVGFPKAQILVYKGSHGLHKDFASALFNECSSN